MSDEFSKLQQSYDSFLAKALDNCNMFTFNPANLNEERSKFKKNKNYSPQFQYTKLNEQSLMYKDILSSLTMDEKSGSKIINALLIQKHKESNNKLSLANSVGHSSFTKKSLTVYGKPSSSLIKKAEDILSLVFKQKRKTFIKSDEVVSQLRKTFQDIGVTGWKINKIDMLNSASVICETRTFKLRKRERLPQNYIDRLKVHEIGTHAVRYENGSLQPLKILKHGLKGYLSTEEGLAMYSEELCDVSSPAIKRNYAGRVLAVKFALESSFNETYKNLLEYFKPDVAFKLALRAKRGLQDTNDSGGFTKDYVYLKGYFDVKKFAKKNDLRDLYIGKIGIKDIPQIKQLTFLKPPKYLPLHLRGNDE